VEDERLLGLERDQLGEVIARTTQVDDRMPVGRGEDADAGAEP